MRSQRHDVLARAKEITNARLKEMQLTRELHASGPNYVAQRVPRLTNNNEDTPSVLAKISLENKGICMLYSTVSINLCECCVLERFHSGETVVAD